jgi:hypothetical protein
MTVAPVRSDNDSNYRRLPRFTMLDGVIEGDLPQLFPPELNSRFASDGSGVSRFRKAQLL